MDYNTRRIPENYITTSLYPNSYYWEQIKKSIKIIVSQGDLNEAVKKYANKLAEHARELNVSPTSNEVYNWLCYYACQLALMEACVKGGKHSYPYVAYALEYYTYDLLAPLEAPHKREKDESKFYNSTLCRFQDQILLDSAHKALLNNITNSSSCPVVDIEKIRRNYKQIIDRFYNEYPQLEETRRPSEELQNRFNTVSNDLFTSIDKAVKHYKIDKKRNTEFSF